jgi:hypothetical protein
LLKDGWVFGGKWRGDRSGMEFENLKGVPRLRELETLIRENLKGIGYEF